MDALWVGKAHDGGGGDEIYDRKMIAALRELGSDIETLSPEPIGKFAEVLGLLRGMPYYRARYASHENSRRVGAASLTAPITVVSWEPFDRLSLSAETSAILILHNVTSDALPQMYPGHPLVRWLAERARVWETRLYRSRKIRAIVVLSERDRSVVAALAPDTPCHVVPPGMPPCHLLEPRAALKRELVLSGTYDWRPKRRDVEAFAMDYIRHGLTLPILSDGDLPAEAHRRLKPGALDPYPGRDLRFGLVVDRFVAGHKLKVTSYIAHCCAVISYVDISSDFEDIPDADLFIRQIGHAGEIEGVMRDLEAIEPMERNIRFRRFQLACQVRFDWKASAMKLASLLPVTGQSLSQTGT
jgi:hypothetical protein